jgi:hypothetical protein
MKIIPFVLLTTGLLAQEATPKPPTAAITSTNNKSIIMIDSKTRANDWCQAFDALRKDKPTLKIMALTSSGVLQNVTDITAPSGGTLLMVKLLSNQGIKTQFVPVEEMMEITYSP